MIITTTMHIENKPVQEYKGIVFGEVVEGRNFVKDFIGSDRLWSDGRKYKGETFRSAGFDKCSLRDNV